MNAPTLIGNAVKRCNHFSATLSELSKHIAQNSLAQENFVSFVKDVSSPNRQVHFIAVGKSGFVARLAASMFASVGVLSRFLHPTEALHGDLGAIRPGDIVLLISNNGRSSEIIEMIPRVKDRDCKLYALTAKADSPLAQQSDVLLPLPTSDEACPLNQAPLTSTVSTLAYCQLLVAATMEHREFGIQDYAKNHPGGVIGKRIFLKVADIMMKPNHLPLISAETSFADVISALTRAGKGGVLVADKNQTLLGIVSEKDIRTAMAKHDRKVFDLHAKDLMNSQPVTLKDSVLAIDAFKVMENRERPLNFVPIVDEERKILGMLHLHDLVGLGFSLQM